MTISRRALLKAGAAAFLLPPILLPHYDEELDSSATPHSPPNSYQKEFIKRLASRVDYLCLGDTDHRRSLNQFALHTDMVGAIGAGGIDTILLEHAPSDQDVFAPDLPNEEFLEQCTDRLIPSWVCDSEAKKRSCEVLGQALKENEKFRFVPIDQRFADGTPSPFSLTIQRPVRSVLLMPFYLAARVSDAVYGCVTMGAFLTALPALPFVGKEALDDTKTFAAIQKLKKPAALFFGAGHFKRSRSPHSMRHLFEKSGDKVCVVNVVEKWATDIQITKPEDLPDAFMYIVKPEANQFKDPNSLEAKLAEKTGIWAKTPETLRLLKEVAYDVDHKAALNTAPGSELTQG